MKIPESKLNEKLQVIITDVKSAVVIMLIAVNLNN